MEDNLFPGIPNLRCKQQNIGDIGCDVIQPVLVLLFRILLGLENDENSNSVFKYPKYYRSKSSFTL